MNLIAWVLAREKQISRAVLNKSKPEIIQKLELKKQILQKSEITYNHCCYSISTCLHPFDIYYNTLQTTETVGLKLEDIQATLQNIYTAHKLQVPRNSIRKLKNQVQSLSSIVVLWWSWVVQCLANLDCEVNVCLWVREYFLPVIYWQQQVLRTKNPHLRQDYQAANIKANQIFEQHPFTQSLSQLDRERWSNWGIEF